MDKMNTTEQIIAFLSWFCRHGINAFDTHVRKPRTPNEDYKKGNWVWLTNHENVTCDHIITRLLRWLRQKNANGSDVFFRPHKAGCHNVIFLDDIPTKRARAVLRKYGGCSIETHPGNTQVWLKVDRQLTSQQRKQAQMILRDLGFTDPGSVSGDHLGRICGFVSQKRNCWVNLLDTSDNMPWSPKIKRSQPISPGGFCASKKHRKDNFRDTSDSGREWGWVMGMLRVGISRSIVTEKLIEAAIKRGKPNAVRYAHYTVQKAFGRI